MPPFAVWHPFPPWHLFAGTKRAINIGEEKSAIVVGDIRQGHVGIEKGEGLALGIGQCRVEHSE